MNSKDKSKLLLIECFLFLAVCIAGGVNNVISNPATDLNITTAIQRIPDLFFSGALEMAAIIIILSLAILVICYIFFRKPPEGF
ncbi:MAG: hypothetical protein ACPK85_07555 [Methanosarcina sp.]